MGRRRLRACVCVGKLGKGGFEGEWARIMWQLGEDGADGRRANERGGGGACVWVVRAI